jgi:uncharacterized protein YodC (DUF2158 family)
MEIVASCWLMMHGHTNIKILLTFRGNLSVTSSEVQVKMGPIGCPETSVNNYQSTLRNIPEERRSNLYRCGSLKSRNYKETGRKRSCHKKDSIQPFELRDWGKSRDNLSQYSRCGDRISNQLKPGHELRDVFTTLLLCKPEESDSETDLSYV